MRTNVLRVPGSRSGVWRCDSVKFWVWILQHFQKEVSDDEEEEEKLKSQNSRTEMDLHLSGTRVSTSSDAAGGPSALNLQVSGADCRPRSRNLHKHHRSPTTRVWRSKKSSKVELNASKPTRHLTENPEPRTQNPEEKDQQKLHGIFRTGESEDGPGAME